MNEKEVVKTMNDAIECIQALETVIGEILTRQKNLENNFLKEWSRACDWESESNANFEEAHKLSSYAEFLEMHFPEDTYEQWRAQHGVNEIMANHIKEREEGV